VAEQGNTRYQALTTLLSLFGNKRSRNVPHIMVLSLEVVPLLSEFMLQIDLLTTLYGDDDDDSFPSILYSRMNFQVIWTSLRTLWLQ
jgi:hypothetical protein